MIHLPVSGKKSWARVLHVLFTNRLDTSKQQAEISDLPHSTVKRSASSCYRPPVDRASELAENPSICKGLAQSPQKAPRGTRARDRRFLFKIPETPMTFILHSPSAILGLPCLGVQEYKEVTKPVSNFMSSFRLCPCKRQ